MSPVPPSTDEDEEGDQDVLEVGRFVIAKYDEKRYVGQILDIQVEEIQDELDETTCVWDSHVIRPSKNDRVPSGRPKVMYMFPELYTTEDCVSPVEGADAQLCRSNCTFRPAVPCDTDIYNICNLLMMESQLNLPADSYQALDLYLDLRNTIRSSL
ncbi:ABC transporter 7 [Dissostichus eleginoides]|uniref:ABC transporter 7 n=1 Tax=Dissostichus eleginoides TaxID=100907 RepID=A0AAD9CB84_DISEL|nr:ABC transporter 7 [Dissostichus eleginoides]